MPEPNINLLAADLKSDKQFKEKETPDQKQKGDFSVDSKKSAPAVGKKLPPPPHPHKDKKRKKNKQDSHSSNSAKTKPLSSPAKKKAGLVSDTSSASHTTPPLSHDALTGEKKEPSLKKSRFAEIKKLIPVFGKREEKESVPKPEKEPGLEVELLTQELAGVRSVKPEIKKFVVAVVVVLLLFGSWGGYYRIRNRQVQTASKDLQEEISTLEKNIAVLRLQEAELGESLDLVVTVERALRTRVDWVALFEKLESLTLARVYYDGLSSKDTGVIELVIRAQTLEDALLQIQVFKQAVDFISAVEVKDFSIEEEKVFVVGSEDENGDPLSFTSSFVEFPVELTLVSP